MINLKQLKGKEIMEDLNRPITAPSIFAKILKTVLKTVDTLDRDKEHFWVIGLDTRNNIKYVDLVSLGTLNASLVHPREIFRLAIIKGVSYIILGHNHPSGDVSPSVEDIKITERLFKVSKIIGIDILDHVIINELGDWKSLKDQFFPCGEFVIPQEKSISKNSGWQRPGKTGGKVIKRNDKTKRTTEEKIVMQSDVDTDDSDIFASLRKLTSKQIDLIMDKIDKTDHHEDWGIFKLCTDMNISLSDAISMTIGEVRQGYTKAGLQFPTLTQQHFLLWVHRIERYGENITDKHLLFMENCRPISTKTFLDRLKVILGSLNIPYKKSGHIHLIKKFVNTRERGVV